jgi:hypothetical protein
MRYFKSKHGMEPLEPRQLFNADLIGTAFDVTNGQPLPGGEVSATFTVKNQNGFWFLDDAGTFKVYVYLSQDAAIGADDLLIGSTSFASLGAGQSITRTIPLAVPVTDPFLSSNDYRIGMIIDPDNTVSESNEANNANVGNALDVERVWFENHVQHPANRSAPGGPYFSPGDTLIGAIGGSDERMGGLDIDSYWIHGIQGQSVAFDLDKTGGGSWTSDLRFYLSNGAELAHDSGSAAPGETTGTGESVIYYTFPYTSYFYLVVSSVGNHTSDPALLTGRTSAPQGAYVINTLLRPTAPGTPDLATASDTGLSSSDNVTNAASLQFSFTGTPGKIGQLFVDGVLRGVASNSDANGVYKVTLGGLNDGQHTVNAKLMDPTSGYASDGGGLLTIRTDTAPPAVPAPDLTSDSDSGLSNSDNITNDNTPTFGGTTESDSFIALYRDGTAVASTNSSAGGAWTITPTLSADGTYNMTIRATDQAGNVSTMSSPLSFTLDTAGPTLTSPIAYQFDTAPQKIAMSFSDDVIATISSGDLSVLDLATSGTIGSTLSYNPATHGATFALTPSILPKGNYRATISSSGVTDVAGNGVAGNTSVDFFFMPGDANHDRTVDVSDLGILATNWQSSGKHFSDGDFNYDGLVDVSDLGILATNWQGTLAAPSSAVGAAKQIRQTQSAALLVDSVLQA